MREANYMVAVDREKVRVLVDLGPWDQYPTITNAAESVVESEHFSGLGNKKLLYVDSEGSMSELVHDGNGKFIDFKFV